MKTWVNKRMSYFVGILNRVGDIFLLGCPQLFSLLNVRFMGISKPHKSNPKREIGRCKTASAQYRSFFSK